MFALVLGKSAAAPSRKSAADWQEDFTVFAQQSALIEDPSASDDELWDEFVSWCSYIGLDPMDWADFARFLAADRQAYDIGKSAGSHATKAATPPPPSDADYHSAVDDIVAGMQDVIKQANDGGSDGDYESATKKLAKIGDELDTLRGQAEKAGASGAAGRVSSILDDIDSMIDDTTATGSERSRALWGGDAKLGDNWYGDDDENQASRVNDDQKPSSGSGGSGAGAGAGGGGYDDDKHPRDEDGKFTNKGRW
ncbi:MAG: hypothetical protein ABL904_17120 [Hyphomicrobiaceae bacterium]